MSDQHLDVYVDIVYRYAKQNYHVVGSIRDGSQELSVFEAYVENHEIAFNVIRVKLLAMEALYFGLPRTVKRSPGQQLNSPGQLEMFDD